MKNADIRVVVGLSGGVDSSVAALLLREKGYDVTGVTMEIYDSSVPVKESDKHACYGPGEKEDVEEAFALCRRYDIPFHIIDLKKEYRDHVIDYVRREYLRGRTPNPCVVCNQMLKFGFLVEKTLDTGIEFDYFATGHYARIKKTGGRYVLKKAADATKDQTYFLYALTPEQLSRTLFPLGAYTKQQVRELARSFGLETAERSESQDFIEGGDLASLFTEGEFSAGEIVDEAGNVLGNHRGIIHYTIGQRRGLGISSPRPLYVVNIDAQKNRIVVSDKENLFARGLIAADMNILAVKTLDRPYRVKAKIRLQHREADATVFPHERDKARVLFDGPQLSVTPGQSVVLYSDDTLFGGGIIEQVL